jgi:segregation and condensation protein A
MSDHVKIAETPATEDDYRVMLPVFEGPLDLLLHLIRKEQLNIYDIPVSQICRTYLEHLDLMCIPDVNIAGEFFVMAASLLYLKSQVLLPKEDRVEDADDPRLPLVAQLLEYERFKLAGQALDSREWLDRDFYFRPPGANNDMIPVESLLDAPLEPIDTFQLLVCLKSATTRTTRVPIEIAIDTTSLKEKVTQIGVLLDQNPIIDFTSLLPAAYKPFDVVISFMATLELAKLKYVEIIQNETFGPIQIRGVQGITSNLNMALLDQF